MDLKEVSRAVGLSKTSIYKSMNAGEFPQSIKIGRSTRWVSTEVETWITEKVRASREDK
ncbi:AlpA family phage regulatory protein [Enterobacter asburiae]|uniref:helix-turn-helix transcriptional regulator n=1 Tax=Enterobacter asburiae TaxID=61645 RepID=UPI002075F924|nr:AlpA family phage regulatory protein [Enterobacter asburiae]MCM7775028.1 AlpA family phage regulatory protein [Enterobacter asburiae]